MHPFEELYCTYHGIGTPVPAQEFGVKTPERLRQACPLGGNLPQIRGYLGYLASRPPEAIPWFGLLGTKRFRS